MAEEEEPIFEELLEQLNDEGWKQRTKAIETLSKLDSEEAVSILHKQFITDKDRLVRHAVLLELTKKDDSKSTQIVIDAKYDKDSVIRTAAKRFVKEIRVRSELTADFLLERIRNEEDQETRLEIMTLLRKLGHVQVIVPLLEMEYPEDKKFDYEYEHIGEVVGMLISEEGGLDELLKGLESKVEGVREEILQMFVDNYGYQDIRGIIPLTIAVLEGDEELSGEAEETLYTCYEGKFGVDKFIEMLDIFEKKNEQSQKAAELYRKIRVKNLVEAIRREYSSYLDRDSRGELTTWSNVYILEKYKAHEELTNLIYNSDEETANHALGVLHRLSKNDSASSVREACKKALQEYEEYQRNL